VDSVKESDWGKLKGEYVKREGWFVPTLHITYAQPESTTESLLKDLCSRWLLKNFDLDVKIEDLEVLDAEEIDKTLGLVGIKFSFSNGTELMGDSVAFLPVEEIEVKS